MKRILNVTAALALTVALADCTAGGGSSSSSSSSSGDPGASSQDSSGATSTQVSGSTSRASSSANASSGGASTCPANDNPAQATPFSMGTAVEARGCGQTGDAYYFKSIGAFGAGDTLDIRTTGLDGANARDVDVYLYAVIGTERVVLCAGEEIAPSNEQCEAVLAEATTQILVSVAPFTGEVNMAGVPIDQALQFTVTHTPAVASSSSQGTASSAAPSSSEAAASSAAPSSSEGASSAEATTSSSG